MTDSQPPQDPHFGGRRGSEDWAGRHPGGHNYPPSPARPQLPPLDPLPQQDTSRPRSASHGPEAPRLPKKITVTRVAAMRSRQLTKQGINTFRRAATADGADKSGLTALTYATIANFATDAAVAIALANTLFFSATTAESRGMVALYLLITLAPFAIIAPLIGPALDRVQRGRRLALAASFFGRTVLVLVLLFNYNSAAGSFDPWVLYPAALGMLVLSKTFGVLKAAVTPRVLPPGIDLVRTNSRLTVFGLVVGTITVGAIAGGVEAVVGRLFELPGAMFLLIGITLTGAFLSMRIPSWVEVTEGEVPATLTYHGDGRDRDPSTRPMAAVLGTRRQPLGRAVLTSLWGNCTIRVLTGFLTLYVAFVAKSRTEHAPMMQVAMLGLVGVAAAVGNFGGNAAGARLKLGRPAVIVLRCVCAVTAVALFAALTDSLATAAVAALVAAAASALAKVSLDASLQNDIPDRSRASAFGRSETALQLSWVLGGALGILLPTEYWIGFTVVSGLLVIGLTQTILTFRGMSLLPGLGGRRPDRAAPEGQPEPPTVTGFSAPRSKQGSQPPMAWVSTRRDDVSSEAADSGPPAYRPGPTTRPPSDSTTEEK
ncbi:MFS transporter [Hoyosella altamirensis]|uniref:MFS family permease n=1 Tax=Hoyosella altamirensis TaxID=616997 RepID=A0A839RSN7_9ACTN|nr:MFS transporter [Hoyosella altamirensis]MBB3039367.1 MFS family permease [Hoyosella altamirensis]